MKKISFNRTKSSLICGVALALVGVAGAAPTIYYHFSNSGSVSASSVPKVSAHPAAAPNVNAVSGEPADISIPSLNLNLPIINGYYNKSNGQWTLTLNKAQYATPTVEPNNVAGNTLIYGHYRREVFAYLHLIKPGAEADITTSNGYIFSYKYVGTYALAPNDTAVLNYPGGPPRLTVQTCSGAWFQNRQMYEFSFIGYKKAS